RVIAFVVNKGNIYYHALVSRAAREVPGMLFTGGKDLEYRINTIKGLFAVNRRGAALWAWAEEPGVGHVVGKSRDVALDFFEDVLPMRLGNATPAADGSVALRALDEHTGFLGDYATLTFKPMGAGRAPGVPTAWLPTERVARAWQAMVSGQTVER
ncbi:MAG TPA: hypothetical protein VIJ16_02475, partial [Gemmatimonadaceae bacterium]